jgi:hypothetical protein
MKKSLLMSAIMMASFFSGKSQVIFSENFDAVPLTSGTGQLPAGWVQYNLDNKTPTSSRSFMTNKAWVVRSTTAAPANKWATSCSWYAPPGIANDWMVTPSIAIPSTGTVVLQFDVKANDASYPDGYEIYVSTTGTAVADFGTSPIFSEASADASAFQNKTVDLTSYAGQNIYIAFRNNSNDMDLLFVDNIVVKTLSPNDAKLVSVDVSRYLPLNSNTPLTVELENRGANTISDVTIDWNDGVSHSQTITGLNIPVGSTAMITHPTNISYATALEKNIIVSITQVNNSTDPDPTNNAVTAKVNSVSSQPTKYVLMEEGTGTWCGWCPRGALAMQQFTNGSYPQFIGIAVHNGDVMTVSAYNAGASLSGYPGCNVDRTLLDQSVSATIWSNLYNERKVLDVPAAVSVSSTYDPVTRTITATASANFVTPFAQANFRLGVIVVEDSVTGTTAAYNQTNYYAVGGAGNATPMGPYNNWPSPVPASLMVYDHVGRALLGGYSGEVNTVPGSVLDGTVASKVFTYTLPATYDHTQIKLVGVLIDQTDGSVVNAKEEDLNLSLGVNPLTISNKVSVIPNPADQVAVINIENAKGDAAVKIYNTIGQLVWSSSSADLNTGKISINTNSFESGNYIVEIINGGIKSNAKLVVAH